MSRHGLLTRSNNSNNSNRKNTDTVIVFIGIILKILSDCRNSNMNNRSLLWSRSGLLPASVQWPKLLKRGIYRGICGGEV